MTLWSGLWVPKGTPKEIVAKLNAAAIDALNDPAVRKQLENLGLADAAGGSAHAGGARRLAESRNRKMVADDQGRQRQGGVDAFCAMVVWNDLLMVSGAPRLLLGCNTREHLASCQPALARAAF